MKIRISILFYFMVYFLIFQIASAEENKYGIVKAWFNGENATVETINGIQLKIGEPAEVKVEVISKINGHISLKLKEPGITTAYAVLSGPSKIDEKISNLNIESDWLETYTWSLIPNGAWKNGNAPINIIVQFHDLKTKNDEIIQFTIANPYILDEQYSGAVPTPETTPSPAGTEAKAVPFLSVIFTVSTLIMAWSWRRGKQ
ncbi:MAG TPA: sarcinarray family MAST domain-containing protein [Candidatus Methanoperedens sp.]|nr:sarcinarray family MAST domain-containing protein [Candidatus Methanoperedens sp.]